MTSAIIVTLLNLFICCVLCKKSFTLVLDTTASMDVEINVIKSNMQSVFYDFNSTNFGNYILLTFKSQDTDLPQEFRSPQELVSSLNDVIASGGENSCPENSPLATEKALSASEPGSLIFVFTNAYAKEYNRVDEIKELCLKKQTKVTIFLSGSCGTNIGDVDVLYDIARFCSGMVIKLRNYRELKQAFPLMKEMIKDDWEVDVKQLGHESRKDDWSGFVDAVKYRQEFPMSVNTATSEVILAISGVHPTLNITDSQGRSPETEDIVRATNSLVKRMTNPVLGVYRVEVTSQGKTSMAIFRKKQFPYMIGFSTTLPNTIEETSERPMPAHYNYVFVYVQDAQHIELHNIEVLELSTNEKMTLGVVKVDGYGAYCTNTPYLFKPYDNFVLNINGYIPTSSLEQISETSPVLEPQYVRNAPHEQAPVLKIIQPHSTLIPYKSNVRLACKIQAYPKPEVWWEGDDGEKLNSTQELLLEMPSTYLTYIEVTNVLQNTTMTCKARNHIQRDSATIELFVHREFTFEIIERPEDQTVPYASELTLKCKVDSYPKATIKWLHNNTYVESSSNIEIDPDDKSITIKRMSLEYAGRYVCEASNDVQTKVFSADIDVSGLESPEIKLQQTEIRSKPGDSVQVECRIEKGTPHPNVTWQYKSFDGYDFGSLPDGVDVEDGDGKLSIGNLNSAQKGIYKCKATNILGEDSKDVRIKIEYSPVIKSDVKNIVVIEDHLVELPCKVDAEPAASVRWELCQDDVIIPFDDRHSTDEHHTHRFVALMKDAGNYHCLAENAVGKSELTIRVEVNEPPFIKAPERNNYTVQVGSTLRLPCNVIKGHPTPTVRWEFTAVDSVPKALGRSNRDSTTLVLDHITKNNEGTYMCTAENIVDNDNVKIYVKVV